MEKKKKKDIMWKETLMVLVLFLYIKWVCTSYNLESESFL